MKQGLTLKEVLALLCADVDIFLLREKDQQTDKDKTYTAREIRVQLTESSKKLIRVLESYGISTDRPV